MLIEGAPRRRRRLPLTALVDVVFLLVIFFVASSSFLAVGRIGLVPASVEGRPAPSAAGAPAPGAPAARPAAPGEPARPDVLVTVRADGRTLVNGDPTPRERLRARLAGTVADGARRVLVTVAPGATVEALAGALAAARAAGFASVSVRAPPGAE